MGSTKNNKAGEHKSLTKRELLEWANFLYGRYDAKFRKRRLLNKKLGGAIIKLDTNRDNIK